MLVNSVPRFGWHATPDFSDYDLTLRTLALVDDARSFDAATPPIILGIVAVIVGLGSRVRQGLADLDRGQMILPVPGPSRQKNAPTRHILAIWDVTELFASSFIRVLVVGFVLFVAAQAVRGEPPTLDLLIASLTRTIDLAVKLVGMLAP